MTLIAPVIVAAELGATDFAWLDRLRRAHFPPDRNQLPAHLTLFHHLPPSLLAEIDSRLGLETRGMALPWRRSASRCFSTEALPCGSAVMRWRP
jgi:hypothetical protein